ncbi:MAG: RlpA-like double-psi beta-barrel domain-containing protein [Actinomycetes bacterium]
MMSIALSLALAIGQVGTPAGAIRGQATWYRDTPGHAAAGPALRDALGPDWRGQVVTVSANGRSVVVTLTDWCACNRTQRVIDLDIHDFGRLARPSVGVLPVTVTWGEEAIQLPETDTVSPDLAYWLALVR